MQIVKERAFTAQFSEVTATTQSVAMLIILCSMPFQVPIERHWLFGLTSDRRPTVGGVAQWLRASVFGWRTFPDMRLIYG